MAKTIDERATIIQQARGCILCLNWSGNHQVGACQAKSRHGRTYEPCKQLVNGSPCGKRHNDLLHGTGNKYCNSVKKVLTNNYGCQTCWAGMPQVRPPSGKSRLLTTFTPYFSCKTSQSRAA